jgi:hypothetical protein
MFAKKIFKNASIIFVISSYLSTCNKSRITERILIKFYIMEFFETLLTHSRISYNQTTITGTLHGDLQMFLCLSWALLPNSIYWSKKCLNWSCRMKWNTPAMSNIIFFFFLLNINSFHDSETKLANAHYALCTFPNWCSTVKWCDTKTFCYWLRGNTAIKSVQQSTC